MASHKQLLSFQKGTRQRESTAKGSEKADWASSTVSANSQSAPKGNGWGVEGKKRGRTGSDGTYSGSSSFSSSWILESLWRKKKTVNRWRLKTVWMSLVNMQRNKVKKLQILCYFVTVSLVFKYVYFYSYTINSYSIVPWVIFTVTIYFYSFKSICYFLLHHSLKSLICTVIRRF